MIGSRRSGSALFLGLLPGRRVAAIALGAGLALACLATGLALAFLGDRFGWVLIPALPLGALTTIAIFAQPLVGLMLVFLILPAGLVELPTEAVGLQAPEIVMALVIGVVVIRRVATGKSPLPWAPQMSFVYLIVGWALLATPGAFDTSGALKQTIQIAGGATFALAVVSVTRTFDDMRLAVAVLLVVGTGITLVGLANVGQLQAGAGGITEGRAQGMFQSPNGFGGFTAPMLLAALGLVWGARTAVARLWASVAAMIFAAGLIASLSRGAWIGTVLSIGVLIALLPKARRVLLLFGLPAVILGASLVAAFAPPDQPQVQAVRARIVSLAEPRPATYDNRPTLWREALRQIRERPLLGSGPANYAEASAASDSLARTFGHSHAHNAVLTVAAEAGIPAAALMVAFTVAMGLATRRFALRFPDPADVALVAGVAAALFHQVGQGLVDDITVRDNVLGPIMWALLGFLLMARQALRDHETRETPTGS